MTYPNFSMIGYEDFDSNDKNNNNNKTMLEEKLPYPGTLGQLRTVHCYTYYVICLFCLLLKIEVR